jgi:RNA polymerase sigma-70 factor (ECF subfamily)
VSNRGFHTTRWSLVVRAAAGDAAVARAALDELCEQYWYPLYAWLRRGGRGEADAWDLVQSFCLQLLERGGLQGADADRGAFRHYLLGALRHHVANQNRREATVRRGGGTLSWSLDGAEARYLQEPEDLDSPERLYERRWAMALLERAMVRLREEYRSRHKEDLLQALEPALLAEDGANRHADTAANLGISEGAVKVALHRLRARLRDLVRDEVAQTLDDPGQTDAELRFLFDALGS